MDFFQLTIKEKFNLYSKQGGFIFWEGQNLFLSIIFLYVCVLVWIPISTITQEQKVVGSLFCFQNISMPEN